MSDKEIRIRQDELAHAHAVWDAKGLSRDPTTGSLSLTDTPEDPIWDYIQAYRGQQWASRWCGLDPLMDDLATTPLFFSTANTFQAGLMAREPRIQVLPRRPDSAADARIVEALLNYDVGELKMAREFNDAVLDAFLSPFGIVRHFYTPEEEHTRFFRNDEIREEEFTYARPNRPGLRRVKPWDVRIDPLASTPHSDGDATWVAFRSLMTRDQIRHNPNMTLHRDMTPTVSMDVRETRKQAFGFSRKSPRMLEFFEIWHVYDKREKAWWAFAHGHDKPVREKDDWPEALRGIDGLPYDALFFNPQMDQMFPVPYAASIWNTILERNKVRTIMLALVKRMRRLIGVDSQGLDESDFQKLAGSDLTEIFRTNGLPGQVIQEITSGGFEQPLLLLDQLLKEDVREALGQSTFSRGQRANVESAQEAFLIGAGDQTNHGRNVGRLEDFLNSAIRHFAQMRQATFDATEEIPLMGVEDIRVLQDNQGAQWLSVTPEMMEREYDFRIRVGSTLPLSRDEEVQEAFRRYTLMKDVASVAPELVNLQQAVMDVLVAQGVDPTKYLNTAEQIRAVTGAEAPGEGQAQALQGGNGALPPELLEAFRGGGRPQ